MNRVLRQTAGPSPHEHRRRAQHLGALPCTRRRGSGRVRVRGESRGGRVGLGRPFGAAGRWIKGAQAGESRCLWEFTLGQLVQAVRAGRESDSGVSEAPGNISHCESVPSAFRHIPVTAGSQVQQAVLPTCSESHGQDWLHKAVSTATKLRLVGGSDSGVSEAPGNIDHCCSVPSAFRHSQAF